jgi:iron-sulfur cluster assembly accessory protein
MSTIQLTVSAKNKAKQLLQKSPGDFHIAVKKTGCSGWQYVVNIQAATPDDEKIMFDDLAVYIAKDSIKFLQGSTLDCVDKKMQGWQWEFINPNVANQCGCGESFSVK